MEFQRDLLFFSQKNTSFDDRMNAFLITISLLITSYLPAAV